MAKFLLEFVVITKTIDLEVTFRLAPKVVNWCKYIDGLYSNVVQLNSGFSFSLLKVYRGLKYHKIIFNCTNMAEIYVTDRNCNFEVEDCSALNCNLSSLIVFPKEKRRTLRVKNCLFFDVELFLKLMTSLFRRYGGGRKAKRKHRSLMSQTGYLFHVCL